MKAYHRRVLSELMDVCNQLGHELDYTATNINKLKDRQKAHALVSKVLFAVLADVPENDHRREDIERANEARNTLNILIHKQYPDKNGN